MSSALSKICNSDLPDVVVGGALAIGGVVISTVTQVLLCSDVSDLTSRCRLVFNSAVNASAASFVKNECRNIVDTAASECILRVPITALLTGASIVVLGGGGMVCARYVRRMYLEKDAYTAIT